MRTLTSKFIAKKDALSGSPVRYPVEIVASTGHTLRYSDQPLTIDFETYETKVVSWQRMAAQLIPGENQIRLGRMNLRLTNSPRIDDILLPGDEVSFYIWFLDLGKIDRLLFFNGNIGDDIRWTDEALSFNVIDKGGFFDKLIGQPLSSASYPSADPDEWGKTLPIIYGDLKNHTPLVIETGAVTTLNGDITKASTDPIVVNSTADPIAFPSSGTMYIGKEKINYVGITATTLGSTSITRVAGGEQTAHSSGDGVFEFVAARYMVAGHAVKEISNVRAVPPTGKLSDAVDISALISSTVNDSGIATIDITAANVVNIRNLVNIAVDQQPDQPITVDPVLELFNDDEHNHAPGSDVNIDVHPDKETDISFNGTEGVDWSFPNRTTNITDQNLNTSALFTVITGAGYGQFRVNRTFAVGQSGTPTRVRARINYDYPGSTQPDVDMRLYVNNVLIDTVLIGIGSSGTVASGWGAISSWADLTNALTRIEVEFDSALSPTVTFETFEIWFNVDYTPNSTNATLPGGFDTDVASVRQDDVIITGSSITDSLGTIICDCKGYADNGSGHYTDTPSALIENFSDQLHHIVENQSNGATDSDIDLASFASAKNNLPASYKFAFSITSQISLNRLLAELAIQCFCRFVWEAGKARLLEIKTSGEVDKSITLDDILLRNGKLDASMRRRGLSEIKNDLEVKYSPNRTLGDDSNPDIYEGTTQDSSAVSVAAYGTRAKVFKMYAIGDNSTMADSLRAKYLNLLKDPRREFTFTTFLKNIELERGDLISLTIEEYGLNAVLGEIINTDFQPNGGSAGPEYRVTALIPAS